MVKGILCNNENTTTVNLDVSCYGKRDYREITSKWDKLEFPEMDGKGVEVRIIKEENYVLGFLFLCLWLQHYKNSLHDTLVV